MRRHVVLSIFVFAGIVFAAEEAEKLPKCEHVDPYEKLVGFKDMYLYISLAFEDIKKLLIKKKC